MSQKFIYVVRHGETDANKLGLFQGRKGNFNLNANGIKQAKKTGSYFKSLNKKFKIYSSPATRALHTAELIANKLKINKKNIIIDNRLNEGDKDILEGKKINDTNDKIIKEYNKNINKYLKENKDFNRYLNLNNFEKHQSKKYNLETLISISRRLNSFFKDLKKTKNSNIIIVTHSGCIKNLISNLFNINILIVPFGDLSNGKNCSITKIIQMKNKYILFELPNTKHLG